MRGNTLAVILSLAILAGSPMSAQAASVGPDNNSIGGLSDGGGRGGGGGGYGRSGGGGDDGPNDRGNNDEGDSSIRIPCLTFDCPPPPPRVSTSTHEAVGDEDCTCRPITVKVNNQTQVVLDCYETRMFNGVKRMYVCKRPQNGVEIQ